MLDLAGTGFFSGIRSIQPVEFGNHNATSQGEIFGERAMKASHVSLLSTTKVTLHRTFSCKSSLWTVKRGKLHPRFKGTCTSLGECIFLVGHHCLVLQYPRRSLCWLNCRIEKRCQSATCAQPLGISWFKTPDWHACDFFFFLTFEWPTTPRLLLLSVSPA